MTRKRINLLTGAFILAILFAHSSFAGQPPLGQPETSIKIASVKLWRGFVNTVTGVGELVRQPILCTEEDGIAGFPVGLISGVCMSIVRMGAGIVDMVTFPVAIDDELGYDSLLNPDFVWQRAKQAD